VTFAAAWTYTMTADRFAGPANNVCEDVDTPTLEGDRSGVYSAFGITYVAGLLLSGVISLMA
jgi:hypothetical protein